MQRYENWQRQEALENLSQVMGVDRYKRRVGVAAERGDPSSAGATAALLTNLLNPTITAITEFLKQEDKRGKYTRAITPIKDVDPGTLAYATVRSVLNSCGLKATTVSRAATALGLLIEAEARVTAFEKTNKHLVAMWMKDLDSRTSSPDWRRVVLVHNLNKRGDNWAPWDNDTKVRVGLALIECMITSCDAAEIHTYRHRGKTTNELRLTEAAQDWITKADNYRSLLSPAFLPCAIPPKAWTDTKGGGYWLESAGRPLSLVKADRFMQPASELTEVMASVNLLQDTAWRVNPKVLAVLREVWDNGLDVPSLPKREADPLPAKPHDIDTNPDALKDWKLAAKLVHQNNAHAMSKRIAVAYTLNVATTVEHDPSIYFPYQLDFRGRVYAVPMWLNPQGPDYAKALLTFAEAKPIGTETGPGWLAIHGANTFGADKITLEERIDWVEQNEAAIRSCAADPLHDMWWTSADKPWQFLAFCFEWAAYRQHCSEGDGGTFMSSLPVMVDGTCNGLQHYSAMLRDAVGGAATNLVPADKPQDIYRLVAERVMDRLRVEMEGGDNATMAAYWFNFFIDRKITKRPVMVLPYGGTQHACAAYVADAVREKGGDVDRAHIKYLSDMVWASIGDVVVSAREAMSWLRTLTLILTKAGISPQWRTPMGLLVTQHYLKRKAHHLNTYLFGERFRPWIEAETNDIDPARSANGLPPNFVHSLDAAALQATVVLANGNGITAFAAIHDSYGTHAASMHTLAACLRYSFVELYEDNDPLLNLRDWAVTVLTPEDVAKIPPLPAKGTLDLSLVKDSDFFFA